MTAWVVLVFRHATSVSTQVMRSRSSTTTTRHSARSQRAGLIRWGNGLASASPDLAATLVLPSEPLDRSAYSNKRPAGRGRRFRSVDRPAHEALSLLARGSPARAARGCKDAPATSECFELEAGAEIGGRVNRRLVDATVRIHER